ncbi:MAG: hypothetical protein QRY74_03570 [Chlamydia sp.]
MIPYAAIGLIIRIAETILIGILALMLSACMSNSERIHRVAIQNFRPLAGAEDFFLSLFGLIKPSYAIDQYRLAAAVNKRDKDALSSQRSNAEQEESQKIWLDSKNINTSSSLNFDKVQFIQKPKDINKTYSGLKLVLF